MLAKKNILFNITYILYSNDSNNIFKFISENLEYKLVELNIININNKKYLFDLKKNYISELKNHQIYNINNYSFIIQSPVSLVEKLNIITIGFLFTKWQYKDF